MIIDGAVHAESGFPLATRNYKIFATVGGPTVITPPLRDILDTGAGHNLIREEVLPEDWDRYCDADAPLYNIVGAGSKRLRQKVIISLLC
jgi:hypothetical protein